MTRFAWTTLAWLAVAALWLAGMPQNAKARGWHYVHAVWPLAALTLYELSDAQSLHGALQVSLLMALVMAALLIATWLWGSLIRNHGVMDVTYSLLPLSAAVTAALSTDQPLTFRDGLLLAMVSIWSLRLSAQTYRRQIDTEREPYATWRRRYGRDWRWWSFFQVYLLQGVIIWTWGLSFAFAFTSRATGIGWTDVLGAVVWLIGFAFQAGADVQLARFKRDPANRGRLLRSGVWSVVRHPNYLGETLIWWGYFLFALAHPWGALAIISPLYVTWFMQFGSAVPSKEGHMGRTRPAEWADYAANTPLFLPWPWRRPRRRATAVHGKADEG